MSRDYLREGHKDAILGVMAEIPQRSLAPLKDQYPWSVILFRWFLVALEMGLATYFVVNFKIEFGLLFVTYGVICVFLLLPFVRCVRCYYYGKRCNFGWGEWVSKIFPQDQSAFSSMYGYTILFWPLRILPLGLGAIKILGAIRGAPELKDPILFGIYLLTLIIHRRFYRSSACVYCHQRTECPVYDSHVMSLIVEKSDMAQGQSDR
jgi:hypothetical protein